MRSFSSHSRSHHHSSIYTSVSSFDSFANDEEPTVRTRSCTRNRTTGPDPAAADTENNRSYHSTDTTGPLRERARSRRRRRKKTTRSSPRRSTSGGSRRQRRRRTESFDRSGHEDHPGDENPIDDDDEEEEEEEEAARRQPKKLGVLTHRQKDHDEYLQLNFESIGECHPLVHHVSRHRRTQHSRYAQLSF